MAVDQGLSHPSRPSTPNHELPPAHAEKYEGLRAELTKRRLAEWAEYGEALRVQLDRAIAAMPGLNVPVKISIDTTTERYGSPYDRYSLEWLLLEQAASRIGSGRE
ncbi:hypothetical protein ACIPY5_20065 [Microbacterium sp. NPDC089698]|uniref:hypothetical protein n=1 Tax=Microbacterium sp. NPDC089698 TaxID=3364200 RepID=UPI0038164287